LLLVGYGAKDSTKIVGSLQYEGIYQYQMMLGVKDSISDGQREKLQQEICEKEAVQDAIFVNMQNVTIAKDDTQREIQLMVLADETDLEPYIRLRDYKKKKPISWEKDQIILTEKMAEILDVKIGDKIQIQNEADIEKEVTIGGITQQYIANFVYMRQGLYHTLFDETTNANIALVKTEKLEKSQETVLGKELLENKEITSIRFVSDMQVDFGSLNFVIVALILLSGALALLVLYNLTNINISERERELATLKVLGFYPKEVDQYVNREMLFLTILGILLGLIGGTLLSTFVLTVAEREPMIFPKVIRPISYAYTFGLMLAFAGIMNFVSHYAMKKINMIDSLKSIE